MESVVTGKGSECDAWSRKRVVCGFWRCFPDNQADSDGGDSYPEKAGTGKPSHGIGRMWRGLRRSRAVTMIMVILLFK